MTLIGDEKQNPAEARAEQRALALSEEELKTQEEYRLKRERNKTGEYAPDSHLPGYRTLDDDGNPLPDEQVKANIAAWKNQQVGTHAENQPLVGNDGSVPDVSETGIVSDDGTTPDSSDAQTATEPDGEPTDDPNAGI